jgi:hypothetical protein
LAVLILWPLFASLKNSPWYNAIKQYWLHFILFVAGFILIIAPITHYFYTHPGSFVGRSSQVSIFNKDINGGDILGTLYTTSKESLLAYFNKGDLNWRHNISGYAFLSPLVSPFFALGLVIVTIAAAIYILIPKKRQEYWKYALIAGCFWGMLIPVVTTAEGIPHGLRSIGTIPWVFIISALGLYWVMEKVGMFVNYFWPKIEDWKNYAIVAVAYAEKYSMNDWKDLDAIAWRLSEKVKDPKVLAKAETLIKRSIQLEPNFLNHETHAQVLFKLGKYKEAHLVTMNSIRMAKEAGESYENSISLLNFIIQKLLIQLEAKKGK